MILYFYFVLGQSLLGNAKTGIHNFNVDLASLGTSLLETAVLFMAVIIISSVGGQGIQKPVRQSIFIVGIAALFFKSYTSITTGAMALF